MELPHYFYLNEIFKVFGLGEFGHNLQHVTHMWLIMAILIVGALFLVRGVRLIPTKSQNILEMVIEGLENFMLEITGPEGRAFFPYLATIFLFILFSNLIGLVPGFFSPTANWNTTLAMAICTFFITHYIGFKFHGISYLKQFVGPIWALAPIMIPIELIGHLARVLSLSVRLMGNIFGKEMVLGFFFVMAGLYLAPLPILFLGILVSFIQAVVFMLLSIVYFSISMSEEH
jgi:F-type H+-transporting ATPase subunit a